MTLGTKKRVRFINKTDDSPRRTRICGAACRTHLRTPSAFSFQHRKGLQAVPHVCVPYHPPRRIRIGSAIMDAVGSLLWDVRRDSGDPFERIKELTGRFKKGIAPVVCN